MLMHYNPPSLWHEILESGAFALQGNGLTSS